MAAEALGLQYTIQLTAKIAFYSTHFVASFIMLQ